METRFQHSAAETARMNTGELRSAFVAGNLMQAGKINLVYTHYDRMIIGGAVPGAVALPLPVEEELKSDSFLSRREMGIINVGGKGAVKAAGMLYELEKLECLYLGRGTNDVSFTSADPSHPAQFYLLSAPAHQAYPAAKMTREQAAPLQLGEASTSNRRSLYKYIHDGGIPSCQLVMGLTVLDNGNVWNSIPAHTHTRRMEVYFYFDVPSGQRVMHFMGEPQQTRHLVMGTNEAVISPPWSVHFGCGTSNYGFIWGMAGENKAFSDMDPVPVESLL